LQQVDSLIRSLIRQFSATYGGVPSVLTKLYHSCHGGGSPPSVESLHATLLLILEAFDDVYIVLDALDECAESEELLKWIKNMTSWRKGKLHLLGTSRPVEDIAKYLRSLNPKHVCMMENLITYDIEKYIDSILHQDNAFKHWDSEVKATIKNKLLENVGGMYVCANLKKCDYGLIIVLCSRFRLVSLQMDELRKCLNQDNRESQLDGLPCSLDKVYDRIVSGLNMKYREDALKILQWLSFSARPLKLAEVAQVVGVVPDLDQHLHFKPSRVYKDQRSVLTVCSSFVTEIDGK
jgi:hypothetical protein